MLSLELEAAIDREVYRRLRLLTPDQIRAIRERTGLTQLAMAQLIGVGDKTYTRWESGRSLQSESSDNLIRLVDEHPELFTMLEAQRNPTRAAQVADYVASLSTLKGQNELALAAHGGDLDEATAAKLHQKLRELLQARKQG